MEEYSALYIFNGLQYNVVDSMEVHQQLESDRNFFESYIQSNAGSLEADVPVTESGEEKNSNALASGEKPHAWTQSSTKLFLDLYRERKNKFRDPKHKKRNLWTEILQEMKKCGYRGLNEDTIDRKMRNMKKTYRTIKDNNKNSATGRGRINWLHYETFEDIFSNDCTMNFGPTVSSLLPTVASTVPSTVSSTVVPPSPSPQSSFDDLPSSSTTGSRNLFSSTSSNVSSPEASEKQQQKSRNCKEVYNIRKRLIAVEKERIEALHRLESAINKSNTLQEERNKLLKTYLDSNNIN